MTAPSSPEPDGPEPASMSTSPPADHLAALCQILNLPPKSEEPEAGDVPSSSVEEQFKVLEEQSRSIAGYDATCTRSFVRGTSISRAFYRERLLCTYTVPVASSFAFNVNALVAAPTSVPVKSARNPQSGGKASLFYVDDDLDNIPLAERRRRKRRRLNEPTTSDDIDFCLAGPSVVDPLLHLEDLPPLPSSPMLATSEVASQEPSKQSSEEVTAEVLAEGYAPWASAQPHSSPLPSTNNQKDFPAIRINKYSTTGESESPPGSSSQSNNSNNIFAESEIPPVSSLALVPYHDPDGHDNNNDIVLGSDTPPVSSSPIHDQVLLDLSPLLLLVLRQVLLLTLVSHQIRPNRFAIFVPYS